MVAAVNGICAQDGKKVRPNMCSSSSSSRSRRPQPRSDPHTANTTLNQNSAQIFHSGGAVLVSHNEESRVEIIHCSLHLPSQALRFFPQNGLCFYLWFGASLFLFSSCEFLSSYLEFLSFMNIFLCLGFSALLLFALLLCMIFSRCSFLNFSPLQLYSMKSLCR